MPDDDTPNETRPAGPGDPGGGAATHPEATEAGEPDREPRPAEPDVTQPAGEPDARALERDLDVVQRGRPERAFTVGVLLGALVAVAAAIFVVQNREPTGYSWLWLDFELPLWAAFVGGIAAGIVLMMTALAIRALRRRRLGRRRAAAGRLRQALTRPGPATARRA